jgi:DNA modification methylase
MAKRKSRATGGKDGGASKPEKEKKQEPSGAASLGAGVANNSDGSVGIVLPIAALAADPKNPRKISKEAAQGLGISMATFGPLDIVFNLQSGELVSGHRRIEQLKAAGATQVVRINEENGYIVHPAIGQRFWVRFVRWDSTKQRLANLVANNPELQGEFTPDAVTQLRELEEYEQFEALQLDELQRRLEDEVQEAEALEGNCDPDEVPEPPAEPFSKRGDLWILGEHRILCGDSTSAEAVARLLGTEKPHLMVTDPPYGVSYDPSWRERAGCATNGKKLGKVANDDRADWREAWALFTGDVAYVWHAGLHAAEVQVSLESVGFKMRSQIIWVKDRFALSRGDYHWHHEPAWYAVRDGSTGHWNGDRSQSTRWDIPAREDDGHGHGTQKPVECMARPIKNNSKPGESIYEPFSGSGTTIIASEQLGRRCFAMEWEPRYVDVAVARWEKFTGKKAVRCDLAPSGNSGRRNRQAGRAGQDASGG